MSKAASLLATSRFKSFSKISLFEVPISLPPCPGSMHTELEIDGGGDGGFPTARTGFKCKRSNKTETKKDTNIDGFFINMLTYKFKAFSMICLPDFCL